MDSVLTLFVLPLILAILGAIPGSYILIREWRAARSEDRRDQVAEMTAAGEMTKAAAEFVDRVLEDNKVLVARVDELEKSLRSFNQRTREIQAELKRLKTRTERQAISLREQERIIAQQNKRISDLEIENSRLRERNEKLIQVIRKNLPGCTVP